MLEYKRNMRCNQITHRISASVPMLLLKGIHERETAIVRRGAVYYKIILSPSQYAKELDRFKDFDTDTTYTFHRFTSGVVCRPIRTLKNIPGLYRILSLRNYKRR